MTVTTGRLAGGQFVVVIDHILFTRTNQFVQSSNIFVFRILMQIEAFLRKIMINNLNVLKIELLHENY